MERDELLRNVAPCGLVCYTCTACGHGVVKEHAQKLSFYLTGVSDFLASQHMRGDKKKLDACMATLEYYSRQSGPGCREEETQCSFKNCVIRACTREKHIDFCADCADFPCGKIDLPDVFTDKWKASNTRIREAGVEQYFDEEKEVPHFLRYQVDK